MFVWMTKLGNIDKFRETYKGKSKIGNIDKNRDKVTGRAGESSISYTIRS